MNRRMDADILAAQLIVDADTRVTYRSMYGQPTKRKSFPVAPVPECPKEARSCLLLSVKSDSYAEYRSISEVARAALDRRELVFTAVREWVICRLCSRSEMRGVWAEFERRRAATVLDDEVGACHATRADKFLSTITLSADQAARDMLRAPRTRQWVTAWNADVNAAVGRLIGVLARNPAADRLDQLPGVGCDDPLATISGALRAYAAREVSLRNSLPNRERPNAERRAFAAHLTRWTTMFLDSGSQALVATVVGVLFGCAYSTRQLRRDIADKSGPAT